MKNIPKVFLFFILFTGCGPLFAQDAGRERQIDSLAVSYLQTVRGNSTLYYGDQQLSPPRSSNHPYLNDVQFSKARLSYHGVIYPEALLRFDIWRNELVILSPNSRAIVLYPEYVDFAELHGKHILYFRNDSLPGSPSTGYYILLYSGKCKILERNTAVRESRSTYEQYYLFKKEFYLYKDGVYHTIRNKRMLLAVLQPYKKELKQYISSRKLRFREQSDLFLVRTISEYEKLTKSL